MQVRCLRPCFIINNNIIIYRYPKPTPVSALIHAATYFLFRIKILFQSLFIYYCLITRKKGIWLGRWEVDDFNFLIGLILYTSLFSCVIVSICFADISTTLIPSILPNIGNINCIFSNYFNSDLFNLALLDFTGSGNLDLNSVYHYNTTLGSIHLENGSVNFNTFYSVSFIPWKTTSAGLNALKAINKFNSWVKLDNPIRLFIDTHCLHLKKSKPGF